MHQESETDHKIASNLDRIHQIIKETVQKTERKETDITLLAVSKTRPAIDIQTAHLAGQIDFGENYLQEALEKMVTLQHLPLIWHFIGQLQSNKTRSIAEHFSWVHTLSSFKHAKRLNEQRPESLSPLNVCIQVNLNTEKNKGGVAPSTVKDLALQIQELHFLKLRGLMAIPQASKDNKIQKKNFHHLSQIQKELNQQGFCLDTLSMGMSNDLIPAIQEGSTIIRIGTAIFGSRNAHSTT